MNQRARAVARKMRKHGREEREIRVKCRSPRIASPPPLSSINWGSLGHSEMWEDSEEGSPSSSPLFLRVEDLDTKFFLQFFTTGLVR